MDPTIEFEQGSGKGRGTETNKRANLKKRDGEVEENENERKLEREGDSVRASCLSVERKREIGNERGTERGR